MIVIDTKTSEAGAPEVEVTPAMIEAGLFTFMRSITIAVMEQKSFVNF
jgi:hypothetical protein